ncbi:MAG: toll/interleukin-1 receptor domain-containing protein [Aestuariivirga sp.]
MMAAKVFISYSHKDEELRNQLEVQLAMLKREGLVEVWHDRRMLAGDRLDWTIDENLNSADIILLLLSPDFLASDYCYKMEKATALQRAQSGQSRLISVVLRPCDWEHTDLPQYVMTPKDAKPITKWANSDEAFLNVVQEIRRAISQLPNAPAAQASHDWIGESPQDQFAERPRSSNMRLTKVFTDADGDAFLHESFEYMAKFFQASLDELKARNPAVETRFRQIDGNRFTCSIFRDGKKVTACTIFLGGMIGPNAISYSHSENGSTNSFNETLNVEHDQHSLFLEPLGLSRKVGNERYDKLTFEGAAELYWAMLIAPLQ